MMTEYRVDRGDEVGPGRWRYSVAGTPWRGISRQPLLAACRLIKRMGGDTALRCRLFKTGDTEACLSCTVEVGARLTVEETPSGPKFKKWKPFKAPR